MVATRSHTSEDHQLTDHRDQPNLEIMARFTLWSKGISIPGRARDQSW